MRNCRRLGEIKVFPPPPKKKILSEKGFPPLPPLSGHVPLEFL